MTVAILFPILWIYRILWKHCEMSMYKWSFCWLRFWSGSYFEVCAWWKQCNANNPSYAVVANMTNNKPYQSSLWWPYINTHTASRKKNSMLKRMTRLTRYCRWHLCLCGEQTLQTITFTSQRGCNVIHFVYKNRRLSQQMCIKTFCPFILSQLTNIFPKSSSFGWHEHCWITQACFLANYSHFGIPSAISTDVLNKTLPSRPSL